MTHPEAVKCSGPNCGTEIVWLSTRNGGKMPVDADTVGEHDTTYDHLKHQPHWASCPDANRFRRS